LRIFIRYQKKIIPWFITEDDEFPSVDGALVKKFFDNSYDFNLGWVRRPNSSGTEIGKNGPVSYHIDQFGSRFNIFSDYDKSSISVFGDSYAFCRQVNDDETWESILSKKIESGVLNFGVGNYGLDQAILRINTVKLPISTEYILMCVVPETICRIQSRWKHYLEFGNTLAFKPRYILDENNQLNILQNPIKGPESFRDLRIIVEQISGTDKFYKYKFKKLQFKGLYLKTFIKNFDRYSKIFKVIAKSKISQNSKEKLRELVLEVVVDKNIKESHELYLDAESKQLLMTLLKEFKNTVIANKAVPILMIIPQLADIKNVFTKRNYQQFYLEVEKELGLNVIDFTDVLSSLPYEDCYINDTYGGHLSPLGNIIVANKVNEFLQNKGIKLTV
jgi:hypothetical protein